MVSHYLVSSIQVAGLILALFGFFYLSMKLFGSSGLLVFRPLLPATAVSLGMVATFLLFLNTVRVHTDSTTTRTFAVMTGVLGFLFGYGVSAVVQPGSRFERFAEQARWLTLTFVFWLLGAVVQGLVSSIAEQGGFAALLSPHTVVNAGLTLAVTATFIAGTYLPRYLSEERLQLIGFAFSVVGIFTSFLTAILDVLNIKQV